MNAYRIAILLIISCLYISAAESSHITLTDREYVSGEYCAEDYNHYPAYKEIIDNALEKKGPSMPAYILQNQSYVVCIYGDARGRLIYVAECYQLMDADHYKKIGHILYKV